MNRKLYLRFLDEETKLKTKTINNIKPEADDEQLKEFANQYATLTAHLFSQAMIQETKVL